MRLSKKVFLLASSLLLTVLPSCAEQPEVIQLGREVPEYGALDLAGDSAQLADLRDEVVLLNVWATWCPPCIEEIPALQDLHEQHRGRGLRVVGVSIDAAREAENLEPFAEQLGVTYTLWHDPQDEISRRYRVIGPPTTFLIDRNGVLLWRQMGPVASDDAELGAAIESALSSDS